MDFTTIPEIGSLSDYLGFPCRENLPNGTTLGWEDSPSAFPFLAYQRIYRDYYLNQDLQTSDNINAWFPPDELDFQANDGLQQSIPEGVNPVPSELIYNNWISPAGTRSGSLAVTDGVNAINLMAWRYRNWSVDYYTGCMFAPQRGAPQALPISGHASLTQVSETKNYEFIEGSTGSGANIFLELPVPSPMHSVANVSVNAETASISDGINERMESYLRQYGISGSDLGSFTIEDIRLATEIQAWLERNMRTKAQYNESLRIHFGDAPIDERLTKPYFIGSTTQDIVISEVLQTSETTNDSPLGSMAGHGISSDKSYVGKFHSHEFGLIMGIASIMPDTSYIQQGIPREWSKQTRYDYYFPEFAQLSPQAVLNKEIFVQSLASENKKAFGYIGRFDEMRFRFDRVCGHLSDSSMADYFNYTLARKFDELPTLNSEAFINSNGTVRHDAWTSGDAMPPFIAEFAFDVRAVRPLPVANTPMGLL